MAPSEALVAAIEDARAQGNSTAKAIFEALRATNEWTDVTESAVRKALTAAKALAPALSPQERVLQRKQKERERDRLRNRTGRARPSEDVKRQTTEQKRTDSAARAWARKQRAIEKKQTGIADSYCDADRLYAAESCECSSRAFVSATSALRGMLSRGHTRIGIECRQEMH